MIERVFCERAVNGAARFSDLVLSDATNGLDVMNRPENYYLQTGAAGLGRSAVYFYFGFFRKKLLIVSFDERGHSKISLRAKSD